MHSTSKTPQIQCITISPTLTCEKGNFFYSFNNTSQILHIVHSHRRVHPTTLYFHSYCLLGISKGRFVTLIARGESAGKVIRRLFDLSKVLEDEAFHDFIGALCKLSVEMVSMQSGIGAVAEGSLEIDDDFSSASVSSTSIATPRADHFTVAGEGLVGYIFRERCASYCLITFPWWIN